MARPEIDYQDLEEIADAARQIHEMPPGAEKEKFKAAFKSAHARILQEQDMPVEAIAPDAHLLGILDYGSGMARTALGETALNAKAALKGGEYDQEAGKARGWDAIIPVGNPAANSGFYLEQLGMGEGGRLSNTSLGQMMGVTPGGAVDITPRGALGFALDAGITPRNLQRPFAGKPAAPLAGRTAAFYAKQLAEQQAAERVAAPRGFWPSISVKPERGKTSIRGDMGGALPALGNALHSGIMDPLNKLGELLYKSRFSNADAAAEQAGKKLPSQIMMENGTPGFTSQGIRDGFRRIVDRAENSIDQIDTPAEVGFFPTRPQSLFMEPIDASKASRAAQLPGSSMAIAEAEANALTQFEHAARQDPGVVQMAQEAKDAAGTAVIRDGHILYDEVPTVETLPGTPKVTNNSGFEAQTVNRQVTRTKKVIDQPGQPGGMRWNTLPDGSRVLEPFPATPPTYKMVSYEETVPMREQVHVDRPPTVEPGRPITQTQGTISTNPPAPNTASETADRPFSWTDARQQRRNWQKQAADANLYSKRDPLTPGQQATSDATARLHNELAKRAGVLELEMLDHAKEGLGGELWGKHRDVSGILTGAPYLDREFTGGGAQRATTGSARAISPWQNAARDILGGALGMGQTIGGKALMNPATRNVLAPAARAMWLNNYWQRELEASDTNPYGLIKKYGAKK